METNQNETPDPDGDVKSNTNNTNHITINNEEIRLTDMSHNKEDNKGMATGINNIQPDNQVVPVSAKKGKKEAKEQSVCCAFLSDLWTMKAPVMVVVSVLGTLPLLLLVPTSEGRCAYVLIVMAILWLTEAIPIPVTSLFPVFMFPMVGVLPAADTANSYMGKTSLLFIGGLLVAIAVEETNLHRRLALNVLKLVGSDPKWLMLGLMFPTWFLSMWISNTATASMMVPIVEAILEQLKDAHNGSSSEFDFPNSLTKQRGKKKKNKKEKPEEVLEAKRRIREYGVYRQNSELSGSSESRVSESPQSSEAFVEEVFGTGAPETPTKDLNSGPAFPSVTFGLDRESSQDSVAEADNKTLGAKDGDCEQGKPSDNVNDNDLGGDDTKDDDEEYKRLCKAFSLCIAYAANTGGIATLTGTPPNLVFNGQAVRLYKKYGGEPGVTFLNWMMMVFPLAVLLLILSWLWLGLYFLRLRFFKHDVSRKKMVQAIIHREYRKIGSISFSEVSTLILFIILALLWLSRKPEFVDGWSELFMTDYVDDSTCAVLIGCLFFILPGKRPNVFCWRKRGKSGKPSYSPLLTWKVAQRKMPWGIIVLLGGGFAVAKACTQSGLSDWLGEQLSSMDSLDPWLLNLVICVIVAMATEVTSNTATATLLMPVTFELAVRLQVNPLYLMISTALATSFAFMMPVATPPNAIVFSHGRLSIPDMASAGAMMNVLAVLALTLCVNTWGSAMFDFDVLPDAFKPNATAGLSSS